LVENVDSGVIFMSEAKYVQSVNRPHTVESLTEDFSRVGLREGMTVIVHSSLSSLGYVVGGPVAVIRALMNVVTPEGTIVMPTFTADNTDPSKWMNPPVPESWWQIIRDHMPAYDPAYTPTRKMGKVVEVFRNMPGVIRSPHPVQSFAAWGKHAEWIIRDHSLDFPFGDRSPLARIYDLDGQVLLIGVGYDSNTSFHLGEYRSGVLPEVTEGAAMLVDGKRQWVRFREQEMQTDRFEQVGKEFEEGFPVRKARIGAGEVRLFSQRSAVDFAAEWFRKGKHLTGEKR
jgi:aminoglycoside 3-N-acetyltransferase